MKIAITGHRPNKLGNDYNLTSPLILKIKDKIISVLEYYIPEKGDNTLITGMALGIDALFALIAIEFKIPFIAAIPFKGQHNKWPVSSSNKYFDILTKAHKIVIVDSNISIGSLESSFLREQLKSDGSDYSAYKLQKRNIWMVDNCDLLIGVWDGTEGGTANCINYAKSVHRETVIINPLSL